jgi:hypothetical protein
VGGPCPGPGARRDTVRLAFRGLAHLTPGVLQNGQESMHPVVGVRLTQRELQPVHDLQRVRRLVDQNAQECVGKAGQRPLRSTARAALACCALGGESRGILVFVSGLERGQQALELCQGSPGRS